MRLTHLLLIAIVALSLTASSAVVRVAESAPTDVPCVEECGKRPAEFAGRCGDAGIDPSTCEAQAQGALDACLTACDATAAPTCADQCALKARDRYGRALAGHRNEARAARRARRIRRRCIRTCAPGAHSSATASTPARLASRSAGSSTGTTSAKSSKLPRCLQALTTRPL